MKAYGKYDVIELIGEGGLGKVYRGRDPELDRDVAIKICSYDSPELRERFIREAKIAAGLLHPNIVTVFAFGTEDGEPYLVQEYLEGEDLDRLIARGEPEAVSTKIAYLLGIAKALEYSHQRGVIHRDVKPTNVRIGPNGRVRIMDFGIAKLMAAERQLTRTGMQLGTDAYVSPETLGSEEIDHRTDIFSYGVLAYELLTGARPFQGDTVSKLYYQILNVQPCPIPEIDASCPRALASCIEGCLRKDRDERYHDFSEVAAALEGVAREPERKEGAGALASGIAPTRVSRPPSTDASRHVSRRALAAGALLALVLAAAGVMLIRSRGGSEGLQADRGEQAVTTSAAAGETEPAGAIAEATLEIIGDLPAGVRIDLDGESVQGPRLTVEAGSHWLRASAPGFLPDSVELTFESGQSRRWQPELRPALVAAAEDEPPLRDPLDEPPRTEANAVEPRYADDVEAREMDDTPPVANQAGADTALARGESAEAEPVEESADRSPGGIDIVAETPEIHRTIRDFVSAFGEQYVNGMRASYPGLSEGDVNKYWRYEGVRDFEVRIESLGTPVLEGPDVGVPFELRVSYEDAAGNVRLSYRCDGLLGRNEAGAWKFERIACQPRTI